MTHDEEVNAAMEQGVQIGVNLACSVVEALVPARHAAMVVEEIRDVHAKAARGVSEETTE